MSHIRESYFRVLQIFLLTANNSQYRQPYQPIGYSNRIKNDIFLESAHRGNALHYDIPNRYVSRNNSVPNTYPSPYMPRPSTPNRNFPSQISPTPNRTGDMGRGSARDSRSHGNSRSGRGRFGWRNNSRRYSGTGQNIGFRNTNSQAVTKSDPTMNQKANLAYFDINEDVFHDDDISIIDGHI